MHKTHSGGNAVDWDRIRIFYTVAESGSFTKAGDVLGLSQSAVSRQIGALERELRAPLFHRHTRGLILTEQGELLWRAAREMTQRLERTRSQLSETREHPSGELKVTATRGLGGHWLTPRLAEFLDLYPDIKVTVESLGQRAIEERIFLGQADLGIGVDTQGREGVRSTLLARAEYICILPANHHLATRPHLAVEDLAGEEFIGPMHEADALWNGIDSALADSGIPVSRRLETQHSQILYAFVEAGLGVSIAEPFSAPLFHRLGVAIRPIAPPVYLDFALLEPDIGPTPEIVAWLSEDVRRETAACLAHVQNVVSSKS